MKLCKDCKFYRPSKYLKWWPGLMYEMAECHNPKLQDHVKKIHPVTGDVTEHTISKTCVWQREWQPWINTCGTGGHYFEPKEDNKL